MTIAETNGNFTDGEGRALINVDRAPGGPSDCSVIGDSGAPVVLDHAGPETQATAIGVVFGAAGGGSSNCTQYFTGIEEAMQAWGGGINIR